MAPVVVYTPDEELYPLLVKYIFATEPKDLKNSDKVSYIGFPLTSITKEFSCSWIVRVVELGQTVLRGGSWFTHCDFWRRNLRFVQRLTLILADVHSFVWDIPYRITIRYRKRVLRGANYALELSIYFFVLLLPRSQELVSIYNSSSAGTEYLICTSFHGSHIHNERVWVSY